MRDRVHPRPKTEAFLVSEMGRRLNQDSVREIFVRLSRAIGIRTRHYLSQVLEERGLNVESGLAILEQISQLVMLVDQSLWRL